jgi:16S rRNA (uracil1498-N3)-methyltransferase
MRSLFVGDFQLIDQITFTEKSKLNHLINVIRIKQSEHIRVFNCNNEYRNYLVSDVLKNKYIKLDATDNLAKYLIRYNISCLFGVTKKEAWDDIVRAGIEMGVTSLIACRMERSQIDFVWNNRLLSIIESAMEQSNHYQFPKLEVSNVGINRIDFSQYDKIIVLTSQGEALNVKQLELNSDQAILLIVGPEGGFSSTEIESLKYRDKVSFLSIPGPIKRTPNAVVAGISQILANLE